MRLSLSFSPRKKFSHLGVWWFGEEVLGIEPQDHSRCVDEDDLLVGRARRFEPESLDVELPCLRQVGNAERDDADARIHAGDGGGEPPVEQG